jgi:hypothetical protein
MGKWCQDLFCDLLIACAGVGLEDVAHVMASLAKCRDEPRVAAFVDEQLHRSARITASSAR